MSRAGMTPERASVIRKITVQAAVRDRAGKRVPREIDLYVIVGLRADGTPGEVFLRVGKAGGALQGFCDAWAQAVSVAVQGGEPLGAMARRVRRWRFEPSGRILNPWGERGPDDPPLRCTSLLDAVASWLLFRWPEAGR